jgi:hypothetical protein
MDFCAILETQATYPTKSNAPTIFSYWAFNKYKRTIEPQNISYCALNKKVNESPPTIFSYQALNKNVLLKLTRREA